MANMRNARKNCKSEGEKRVWDFFNKYLSNDFWVWTNVRLMIQNQGQIEANEIDLTIYHKAIGVLVFSIKDWRIDNIKIITNNRFVLTNNDIKANPFLNAEQHRYCVQTKLKKNEFLDESGRPQVSVNSGVILPFIKRTDFEKKLIKLKIMDALDFNIPINSFIFMEDFEDNSVFTNDHQATLRFKNVRDRRYSWVRPLTDAQLNYLDSMLSTPEDTELFVKEITSNNALTRIDNSTILELDEKQKELAHRYLEKMFKKPGHRLIKGIAGSGKTILLQYIFGELAKYPDFKILFIVYNNALMRGIRENLEEMGIPTRHPNYKVMTFHGYCYEIFGKDNIDKLRKNKRDYLSDEALSEYIEENSNLVQGTYDFVLIDEGQDLKDEWIKFLVKSTRENGNVVYTEDFEQNLYSRRRIYSVAGLEVQGQGRDSETLLINYRNTKQISEFALRFSGKYRPEHNDRINKLRDGPIPELLVGKNPKACAQLVCDKIVFWEKKMSYQSGSIAILYPVFSEGGVTGEIFNTFILQKRQANCIMLKKPYRIYKDPRYFPVWKEKKFDINDMSAIKISTLQSSKGLDFDCVILICQGLEMFQNEDKIYNALYVGCTRARHELSLALFGEGKHIKNAEKVIWDMKNRVQQ